MKQFHVTGMTCAACSARVERAVKKLEGVTSCSVNLLTENLAVEGSVSAETVIAAVVAAGYRAKVKEEAFPTESPFFAQQNSQNLSPSADHSRQSARNSQDGRKTSPQLEENPQMGAENTREKGEFSPSNGKAVYSDGKVPSLGGKNPPSKGNISRTDGTPSKGKISRTDGTPSKGKISRLDGETRAILLRLTVSFALLVLLVYCSMGYRMWGAPLPRLLTQNPAALGGVQCLLSAAVLLVNRRFFLSGAKSLVHGAPNMDLLVSLGSGSSFLYSVYLLVRALVAQKTGDFALAAQFIGGTYFESAAMILALITLGKLLESRAKGKTTDAIRALMRLAPETATLLKEGEEVVLPLAEVKVGDLFVLRPGDRIPVDGTVVFGESAVDESSLSGESIPVDKAEGSRVYAGTVNRSGYLRCHATGVGRDTALAKIIRMVEDASATKAPISKLADRVAAVFVPAVLGVALLTAAAWLIAGETVGFALTRAVAVLVISCPCALGLATPVAVMVGSGVGAKCGVLFKTAAALEGTGRIKTVIFDKTGTVTEGKPVVTGVFPAEGVSREDLLLFAASLEQKSEHPLAKAVLEFAEKEGVVPLETAAFTALSGSGVRAEIGGEPYFGGNYALVSAHADLASEKRRAEDLANEGKTPLFFAKEGNALGWIAVSDTLKENSRAAIAALRDMGIRTVMLTGDNPKTARAVASAAGISEVVAGVLPDGKESVVREIQKTGCTAMVGDGVNDAPALTRADVGIAIGQGADVAVDSADVVLVNSRLSDVVTAVRLGRSTLKNIRENLFWAFFYNVIGIPLAAGAWIPLTGWEISPMFGAAAMSLSSFCVVMNALRLNLFRPHGEKKKKENKFMEVTLTIEGMMCPHCEARVKTTLEGVEGVASAAVSFKTGKAVVTLNKEVARERLKAAVEAQGYPVTD